MSQDVQRPIDEIREEKLEKLRKIEAYGINAFPSFLQFKPEAVDTVLQKSIDTEVSVAGRLLSIRGHGGIRFADLADYSGQIQLAFQKDQLRGEKNELIKLIDPGDYIEVTGKLFRTKTEELTIQVRDFNILSKNIRPIPDSREGLKDKETRLRKRYLDLLLNEDSQNVFEIRHSITKNMRIFLQEKGLTEVETPTLQPLYGGANAKPFTVKINALDTEAYLRIASELYLKRLMVTHTKGVFDIAKDFRNEGIDQTHYPEFTMMEAYIPYADYHTMMDVMEALMRTLAQNVLQSSKVSVHDAVIDLNQPWPRTPMTDLIQKELKLDVSQKERDELYRFAVDHDIEVTSTTTKGELVFLIFDKLISPTLLNPTWVIDYPVEISPLSKEHREKEGFTERFELYIGGKEIMDGWSEINNPVVQRQRFESEQSRTLDETETAQPIDEDYLEAMEYGMPPMAGVGIGIDRLTMFFANNWAIQETILFPFKRVQGE